MSYTTIVVQIPPYKIGQNYEYWHIYLSHIGKTPLGDKYMIGMIHDMWKYIKYKHDSC